MRADTRVGGDKEEKGEEEMENEEATLERWRVFFGKRKFQNFPSDREDRRVARNLISAA